MTVYLGENIKRLRRERDLTQETLADFLGVTFQSVSRWERGESYPDITLLPEIAHFFGVSVDNLLGINETRNKEKIKEYLKLYDTMKMVDMPLLFRKYETAVKDFPSDYRILVRYMSLLQEEKLFNNIGNYREVSDKISRIYNNIQKHCTDDSIRIWSKRIMISHLMWKYDCICNEDGKYRTHEEYLKQAEAIVETLPSIHDCKELISITNKENYYEVHKTALEELIFHMHEELFGYCMNYPTEERIKQYESMQNLLELIYPDGNYGKNTFNHLYNYGHLGHLYHQVKKDTEALFYLKKAAEYALELDRNSEQSEQIKRFYNYGPAYREMTASEFTRTIMTEHYPLSEEFRLRKEFKEIIESLN